MTQRGQWGVLKGKAKTKGKSIASICKRKRRRKSDTTVKKIKTRRVGQRGLVWRRGWLVKGLGVGGGRQEEGSLAAFGNRKIRMRVKKVEQRNESENTRR